jgi:hypothetical protein
MMNIMKNIKMSIMIMMLFVIMMTVDGKYDVEYYDTD